MGDRIIEAYDKSAGATALDRTVILDARVARLEKAIEAAAKSSYAVKKALMEADGE